MGGDAPKAWAVALVLAGCSANADVTDNGLSLQYARGCELGRPDRLIVRVAGDFPTVEESYSDLEASITLDDVPLDARWLGVEAEVGDVRAAGLVRTSAQDVARDVLLLPLGRSCPLGDPLATGHPGATLTSLSDAGALVTGGVDPEGNAVASAIVLPRGSELAERAGEEMLLRRTGHTATRTGSLVLVVGGGQDDSGGAHDTYEVFDQATRAFDSARSGRLLGGPRRDHGAVVLGDGRVLVVGGRAGVQAGPVGSAEILDPAAGNSAQRDTALQVARSHPHVIVTTSGEVVVLGGEGSQGPVGDVERMQDELRFETVASLPGRPNTASVALPGNRVAWVGCDTDGCQVQVLLFDGEVRVVDPLTDDARETMKRGLTQLNSVALADGRVLLTARDPDALVDRVGLVIDVSTGEVESVDMSRVPLNLIALDDRTIVELDAFGASLRRHTAHGPFDPPPDDVTEAGAVFDAPGHWDAMGPGLDALESARLDVAGFRFGDVDISLRVEGTGSLLFVVDGAQPVELEFTRDAVQHAGCSVARADGEAATVSRRGARLTIETDEADGTCSVEGLPAHVAIGLRLSKNSVVRALQIERR